MPIVEPSTQPRLSKFARECAQRKSHQTQKTGDDEEFAELLRAQAEFDRSAKPPAANCKRAARPAASPADPPKADEAHVGTAAAHQRRFVEAARASVGHPEFSALAEFADPAAVEGGAESCEEFPNGCLTEVKERLYPSGATLAPPSAPLAGFPVPPHRASAAASGRVLAAPPRVSRASLAATPSYVEGEEDEADAIDKENRQILGGASPSEVLEWQQQLEQQFGSDICEFLRKRGREKERQRASKSVVPKADTERSSTAPADDVAASVYPTDAQSVSKSTKMAAACASSADGFWSRNDLQKMQWMTPSGPPDIEAVVTDASLPPEPAGKITQLLRFDFEGRICFRSAEDVIPEAGPEDAEGLHHHGAESSQAGYTLAELLLLSRSSCAPQRALALRTLARVLTLARVPLQLRSIFADPAVCRVAKDMPDLNELRFRAGFGCGLAVFFWHGVARGDIPKHLAEALNDTSLPARIAALEGTVALLDGAAILCSDKVDGKLSSSLPSLIRDEPCMRRVDPLTWDYNEHAQLHVDAALSAPLDGARELVWPEAPPVCAVPLARRARVLVLSSEGGGGGGVSSWSALMKRRLLLAPQDTEVSGADVLEPLFSSIVPRSTQWNDDDNAFVECPSSVLLGIAAVCDACSKDLSVLSTSARALSIICSWSPSLCQETLHRCCSGSWRSLWLKAAAGCEAQDALQSDNLRLQALRLIRRSCDCGGRDAIDHWAMPQPDAGAARAGSAADNEWTLVTVVRRAILGVIGKTELVQRAASTSTKLESAELTTVSEHCAVEALRIWIACLQCGAGIDSGMFAFCKTFCEYMHRLAATSIHSVSTASLLEAHWFVIAYFLRFLCQVELAIGESSNASERHARDDPPVLPFLSLEQFVNRHTTSMLMLVADVATVLADALIRSERLGTSLPQQLSVASLLSLAVDVCRPPSNINKAAQALLAAQTLDVDNIFDLSGRTCMQDVDVDEAPWPFDGGVSYEQRLLLARLRAMRMQCRFAARARIASALPWLNAVLKRIVTHIIACKPAVDTRSESLVGSVQQDPFAALFAASWEAVNACGGSSKAVALDAVTSSGFVTHSETQGVNLVASAALRACGCWPTAKHVLACVGPRKLTNSTFAEDALLRAAFRPAAPWTPVEDVESRAAAMKGFVLSPLESPLALGPPTLSFAAAPFWALAASPPRDAAFELLHALADPEARGLKDAVPPWLPFVAIVAFLARGSLNDVGSCVGADIRPCLEAYAQVHLSDEPTTWLPVREEWLGECLRGLCDALAKVLTEDSYHDAFLAKVMWAFAAPSMPEECRAVCWGKEDPAVLLLASRALKTANEDGDGLLWTWSTYVGPTLEEHGLLERASTALTAIHGGDGVRAVSLPATIAAHQLAAHERGRRRSYVSSCSGGVDTMD